MRFVDLTEKPEDIALLSEFYNDLFVAGFPDEDERESLETLSENLVKRAAGFYGANNYHILLLLDGQRIVAASIFDYMAASNCGAIEYIVADEAYRGRGLGWKIHEHSLDIMRMDAQRAGKADIHAVMLEVNDPYLVPAEMDIIDPFDRVLMWQRWGYQRLRFPYEQPALSAEQSAIDYLLLAVKVIDTDLRSGFPPDLAKTMVVDYLVWANRLVAFEQDPFYVAMSNYVESIDVALLEDFDAYIGRNRDLEIVEVCSATGPEWSQFLAGFRRHFSAEPTTVLEAIIVERLRQQLPLTSVYHVWLLAGGRGLATFFALPEIGFLGYLALDEEIRGKGLSRLACKRMEEQLIRDRPDITHFYVKTEIGSTQEAVFLALGFRPLPVTYHAPPLNEGGDLCADGRPMALLRKRLGDQIIVPAAEPDEVLRHLETILHVVFGMAAPRRSASYLAALASLP